MRIAQVTPFYPPVVGGVESAVENISTLLVKRGHDVDVYTSSPNGSRSEEIVNGVNVRRFPMVLEIGTFAKFWPTFLQAMRRQRYDVIHTHVYRHPHSTMVGVYSRLAGTKAVISTHGPFHPRDVWGRLSNLVRIHDLVLGRSLNMFEKVFALGELERRILENMHIEKEKIEVMPNGVSSEHLKVYDPKPFLKEHGIEGSYLCYLGRIHPTKGIEFLLRSFAKVGGVTEHSSLLIAGSGDQDYLKNLKLVANELGLKGRVKFLGYLEEEQKMRLLEGCSGLVLPSMYEPYGIVLLEAMAHGKPVIVTPGGADLVSQNYNGLLVRYGDEEGMARHLSTLLTEDDKVVELGRNGRVLANERIWERIVTRLERVYLEICN